MYMHTCTCTCVTVKASDEKYRLSIRVAQHFFDMSTRYISHPMPSRSTYSIEYLVLVGLGWEIWYNPLANQGTVWEGESLQQTQLVHCSVNGIL